MPNKRKSLRSKRKSKTSHEISIVNKFFFSNNWSIPKIESEQNSGNIYPDLRKYFILFARKNFIEDSSEYPRSFIKKWNKTFNKIDISQT